MRARSRSRERVCTRCGRDSHIASLCYASFHTNGSRISQAGAGALPAPLVCTRCGRSSHAAASCYAASYANGSRIPPPAPVSARIQCLFCNTSGHDADHCPRTRPFAERRGDAEPPPRNRRIVNIQGSSWDSPAFRSWRNEAEHFVGPEKICAVLGCGRDAVEGAHVWVEGERRAYFIARLCRRCNHRHGDEEICYCRYIGRGEDPKCWMPIRDMWLYKMMSKPSASGASGGDTIFEPFQEWCRETAPPTHGRFRNRCSRFCTQI